MGNGEKKTPQKETPKKQKAEQQPPQKKISDKKRKQSDAGRQATIRQAFAAAPKKAALLPLEISEISGKPVNNYDSQNITTMLAHYVSEMERKRRWVPAAAVNPYAQVRACRRRKEEVSDDDDDDFALQRFETPVEDHDLTLGDEDAYRYLNQLRELISSTIHPTSEQLQSIVNIMRAHGLHGRKDLSSVAFNLLQYVAKLHPSVTVKGHEEGHDGEPLSYVSVNPNAWTLTESCMAFHLDQFEENPLERRLSPFLILDHLVTLMHAAVYPAPKTKGRSCALTSGDLLFFEWILSEFEVDLRCRLEVFFMASSEDFTDRKAALLQNSQLWRTFSDSASKSMMLERKEIVRKLMEVIAAPAEPELLADPRSLEELKFNVGELASHAAKLLNLMLELYGTAEDSKMFQKHGTSRVTTAGVLENVRMVIESAMVDGTVGSTQVLRTLPQKRAFLLAIPAKDRLRLLGLIVVKGHARRKTDSKNYPNLENLHFLYTNHGSVESYLDVDAAEALQYIADDISGARLALNLLDKTADGLALLVSLLCQAAASELSGSKLSDLNEVLGKVVSAFEELQAPENSTSNRALSPPAMLNLRAAQVAIAAAH